MIASMTAFARQQQACPWGTLIWEIRSVNHRYLEPAIRLPDLLRSLEPEVRQQLRQAFSRGKLDCQLRYLPDDTGQTQALALDPTLVQRLLTLGTEVQGMSPQARNLSVNDILRWPGVLQQPDPDLEAIQRLALQLLQQSLQQLDQARRREGQELAQMIENRLVQISEIVTELRQRMPEILQRQQQVIAQRLEEWRDTLDPARLEQEMVLLAQKCDVDEELDRIETHVSEVRRVLTLKEAVGRRLDFLMQELNREANTLSSKAVVAESTLRAVELKVLIEQMREQVQNIE